MKGVRTIFRFAAVTGGKIVLTPFFRFAAVTGGKIVLTPFSAFSEAGR